MSCTCDCVCGWMKEERIVRRMNADIEVQLKRDEKKSRQEVKLLILGTEQAGKSTFVKQMRIIHGDGYSERERLSFIPQIHSYTLLVAEALIEGMKKLAIIDEDDDHVENSQFILSQDTPVRSRLSIEAVEAIKCLWRNKNVQFVHLRRGDCDFDSAKYFLDSLDRISSPDYIPTDQDILRLRIPTSGVQESFFKLKSTTFRIMDVGGQRGERRKWIHCFDSVTSIIFLASLCEYDQLLDGDSESTSVTSMTPRFSRSSNDRSTKMDISLALFSTIVSYPGFSKTSFILFLNKVDLFEQKILKSHLSSYYPEFTGPKLDAVSAGEFIEELYLTRSQKESQMVDYTDDKFASGPSVDRMKYSPPLHRRWRPFGHQSVRGGNSSDASSQFFSSSSSLVNSDRTHSHSHGEYIHTHFTAATDTDNMRRVFSSVKDTILRRNIQDCLF